MGEDRNTVLAYYCGWGMIPEAKGTACIQSTALFRSDLWSGPAANPQRTTSASSPLTVRGPILRKRWQKGGGSCIISYGGGNRPTSLT